MQTKELDQYWEMLLDYSIATQEELELITSINGYNEDTLDSVLFCRTGYRSYDQYLECDKD